jgi:GR25 family glycosyltransferase involved in LPS biosynthesis
MYKIFSYNAKINVNKGIYEINYKNDKNSKIQILFYSEGNIQFILKLTCFDYLEIETKNKKIIKNDKNNELIFNTDVNNGDFINIQFNLSINSKLSISSIKFTKSQERFNILYEHIFVINLKKDIERKTLIQEEFKKLNITKYEILEAIDGNESKNDEYLKIKNKIKTKGHYGCLLSHKKAILLSKVRKYNNVIILEDDIYFINNFFSILKNLKVPSYDMIYFGGITKQIKIFLNNFSFIYNYVVMGAYSYVLNSKMYDIVLNLIEKETNYIDYIFVDNLQKNKNINILLLNDIIYTNTLTTNTSEKNDYFYVDINKLFIKYNIEEKKISFGNINEYNLEHYYLIGQENNLIDFFIRQKINICNMKQLKNIKNNYNLIILDFFNFENIDIDYLIDNFDYNIIITNYYWLSNTLIKNKNDKSAPWLFNNNSEIIICDKIKLLIHKAKYVVFMSNKLSLIYEKFFNKNNFSLIDIPLFNKINYNIDTNKIIIGIIKTEYFFNENNIDKIIYKYFNKQEIFKIYITNEFYTQNIEEFIKLNKINIIIYLSTYDVEFNPNIEIIKNMNITILTE